MKNNRREQIISELQALQADGVTLPGTPEAVAEIELRGGMVNLSSGQVDMLQWFQPTRVRLTRNGQNAASNGGNG